MPDTLAITLENTSGDEVYAYITGHAIDDNNALVMVEADGHSIYKPSLPEDTWLQPLKTDIAIPLGRDGETTKVEIPHIAGGRIWFSRGPQKLAFMLNSCCDSADNNGAALIEPSVLNPADPNAAVDFCFCEFTYNKDQLYANISYVDFVSRLPIALTLSGSDSPKDTQHVTGMDVGAFETVCQALREQAKKDGQPWDKLIVTAPQTSGSDSEDGSEDSSQSGSENQSEGKALRVLSPMHGKSVGADFDGYYEKYVDAVWDYYRVGGGGHELYLDTQTRAGVLKGTVDKCTGLFTFSACGGSRCLFGPGVCQPQDPEVEVFTKPTTADILSCNSGTFLIRNRPVHNAIVPRLAAAFQRSTMLTSTFQPCAESDKFYTTEPTNHYSRIVHAANLDGRGYAFAYDDVQSSYGADQSGKVNMCNPVYFKVTVGGKNPSACSRESSSSSTERRGTGGRAFRPLPHRNVRFPMYSSTTKYNRHTPELSVLARRRGDYICELDKDLDRIVPGDGDSGKACSENDWLESLTTISNPSNGDVHSEVAEIQVSDGQSADGQVDGHEVSSNGASNADNDKGEDDNAASSEANKSDNDVFEQDPIGNNGPNDEAGDDGGERRADEGPNRPAGAGGVASVHWGATPSRKDRDRRYGCLRCFHGLSRRLDRW